MEQGRESEEEKRGREREEGGRVCQHKLDPCLGLANENQIPARTIPVLFGPVSQTLPGAFLFPPLSTSSSLTPSFSLYLPLLRALSFHITPFSSLPPSLSLSFSKPSSPPPFLLLSFSLPLHLVSLFQPSLV